MMQIKETDRDVIVDSQIWDPTTSLIQHKAKQLAVSEDGNPKLLLSEVMGEDTEKQEKEYGLIPNNQILVNGRSDPYLMSKDKWHTLTLPTEIKTQAICSQKKTRWWFQGSDAATSPV
jgi:hypothetical protein